MVRRDQLVVQELADETLVYDLERHKAHCLNETSALVWKHCDGKTTVAEITGLLERKLATPIEEDVVWLALTQLRRFRLLEEESVAIAAMSVSRRELVRKYLPAALALPVILSIAAPTAAQGASGCPQGQVRCGAGCCPAGRLCCAGVCCAAGESCVGGVCRTVQILD